MKHREFAALLTLPILLIWASLALGQSYDGPAPPPKPASEIQKDPTTPSPKLKEILTTGKQAGMAPKLTPVILRGRVVARNQPALAVLEVEGKTYTVGNGSLIPGGIYRVVDVNSLDITIEVGPLREKMVLR